MPTWMPLVVAIILAIIIVNTAQQLFMKILNINAMFFNVKKKLIAIAVVAFLLLGVIAPLFGN